jgi:hypothetical protein
MSGVSISSSASQREVKECVLSLSEFVGLDRMSPAVVERLAERLFSDKVLAAYQGYLRKFEATSSNSGSEISNVSSKASSSSSWSVGAKLRTVKVSAPKALRAVPPPDGYCYLRAFKLERKSEVRAALGPDPSFFKLLAQPASSFEDVARVKVTAVSRSKAHISSDGDFNLMDVMADLASRSRAMFPADSVWAKLQNVPHECYPAFSASMAVGAATTLGGTGAGLRCETEKGVEVFPSWETGGLFGLHASYPTSEAVRFVLPRDFPEHVLVDARTPVEWLDPRVSMYRKTRFVLFRPGDDLVLRGLQSESVLTVHSRDVNRLRGAVARYGTEADVRAYAVVESRMYDGCYT